MTFKPGKEWNGNRNGRPPGSDQRALLLQAIKDLEEKEGVPFWPTVLKIAIAQANKGKADLLKELAKRLLPEQIEQSVTGEFSGFEFTKG